MADNESKAVVRQFLAAIKGGDGQTMMSLLADDAVVVLPGSFKVAWAGRWQGHEPIKQCFLAIGALLDIRDHTVNLIFGEGEHVMVLIDETSAAKNTGRLLHQETGLVLPHQGRCHRPLAGLRGHRADRLGLGRARLTGGFITRRDGEGKMTA